MKGLKDLKTTKNVPSFKLRSIVIVSCIPDQDIRMVRVEASDHGENERPTMIDRFARCVQDVEHCVQLLLTHVRIRDARQLGLKCPNL